MTWGQRLVNKLLQGFWMGVGFVGLGLIAVGGLTFAVQCLEWLATAVWTPAPLSNLLVEYELSYPQIQALGAQKIFDWILDLPMTLVLPVIGAVLVVFGVGTAEQYKARSTSSP